ncbi:glycosyltransferase [Candidatus Poriferisodalis sp.]|uniref:glycosyltransferase n=1 Tax=Candidatus Poriferisodalis sp. TaxID=3101277 RepID=UPI003B02DEC5
MRVVLVAPGFPTSLDDHHKPFLADHANALADAGADVTVVCPAHPDAPARHHVGNVEVVRVRFGPRAVEALVAKGESYRVFAGLSALWVIPMIAALWRETVRQLGRRAGPDGPCVAHGHWWFPCGLVAVAAAPFVRRAAGVVHVHGSDAAVTTNPVHRWLARRVLLRADAVATVSDDLAAWASSLTSRAKPGPRIECVSMPVGVHRFEDLGPPPPDGPVVGVGRLMAEKGFDVLIEAVATLPAADRPDVVLVGDGPDRTLLEALALRRHVTVQFAGAVAPGDVGEWYRRARLVCVPSRREGFGMVAAEALLANRPVVATAVGGAPSLITDGTNGLLVPPGDPEALAGALTQVLRSDADLSTPSTDTVAPFSPLAHAATLLEIYATLTNS